MSAAESQASGPGFLKKRSMTVAGRRTSIALELEFWNELERLALLQRKSIPMLIAEIDAGRARNAPDASLASALRVFLLLNRTA